LPASALVGIIGTAARTGSEWCGDDDITTPRGAGLGGPRPHHKGR
jgi:hypothetical protein